MSGPQRSARSAAAKSNKKAVAELDIVAPAAAKTPSLLAEPLPLAPAAQMASKDDGGSVAQAMQVRVRDDSTHCCLDLEVSLLGMLAGSKCLCLWGFPVGVMCLCDSQSCTSARSRSVARYRRHGSMILGLINQHVWECCRWLQAPQQLKASWPALPDTTHCCLHLRGENWMEESLLMGATCVVAA